jgi:hypothetical protein
MLSSDKTMRGTAADVVQVDDSFNGKDDGVPRESLDSVSVDKMEKALIRRIDWYLIPLIMLLYLFSFLDRGMCALRGGAPLLPTV